MTIAEILSIPVLDVLDKLWIEYKKESSSEYALYRSWVKSDWWKANIEKNIVADFSHWEWQGNTFSVVQRKLRLSDKETFKWFESNFHWFTPNTVIKKDIPDDITPVLSLREWFSECNDKHIEYMKSRLIEYDKIKNYVKCYDGNIACLIYRDMYPVWFNARTLSSEKSQRFYSKKWYWWTWVYSTWKLDYSLDYLIVVEWMFDFLTLAQFTPNVLWLKNNDNWLEELVELSKQFNIILCNDCDDAGQITISKMKIDKYKRFDICKQLEWVEWWSDVKDINDFYKFIWWGNLILPYIIDNAEWENSKDYWDVLIENMKTRFRLWELAFEYPWQVFRKEFDCLTSWEFVLIASKTNSWKSTIARKILEQNQSSYKCCYVNLEFPIDQQLELLYKKRLGIPDCDIKRKGTNIMPYTEEEKDWLLRYIKKCREVIEYKEYQQGTTIQELINILNRLNEEWYHIIVIDSFSSIEDAKDNLKTQTKLISALHEICKKTWLCIIWVHHFNKNWENVAGSQKIEDLSNVFISITKNENDDWWPPSSKVSLRKDKAFWFVKSVDVVYTQEWEYEEHYI